MTRVVLDTNVLIASAYNPRSASRRITDAGLASDLTLVVSPAVRNEYDLILPKAVRTPRGRSMLERLLPLVETVYPDDVPPVVPEDPEDDKFFAAAVAGGAAALVSNDAYVLAVGNYEGVRVLRPSAFAAEFL